MGFPGGSRDKEPPAKRKRLRDIAPFIIANSDFRIHKFGHLFQPP